MCDFYLVSRCDDFIEGKGPSKNHSVWASWAEADKFIMDQHGVMGTEQKMGAADASSGYWSYNGYTIRRIPFMSFYDKKKFDGNGNVK